MSFDTVILEYLSIFFNFLNSSSNGIGNFGIKASIKAGRGQCKHCPINKT